MKPDGVRLSTILGLLDSDSFDGIPVAVLDNSSNGLCWANSAFEKLCPEDDSIDDFLEHVQRSPSASNKQPHPSSVVYNNVEVRIAWEEGVEAARDQTNNAYHPDAKLAETTTSKGVKVYLPLLGKDNDKAMTGDITPGDQGLVPDKSEIDAQLERSVWTALLTEIPAACLIMDTKGAVRFASRTLSEIFKLPNDSSEWESVFTLPNGCTGYLEGGETMRKTDYPLYRTVQKREVVRGFEFRLKRADDTYGTIRSTSSPVYDTNGEVLGFVAVVEDVTLTYDARQEANKLRARHEAVSRANSLKDEFISRISHELRTPINGLLGLQDLLLSEADGEEKDRYTSEVFQLAHRLSHVVDDLLSVTLDSGRLDPEISAYSMEDMITEVLHSLENQARFQGVQMGSKPLVEPNFPRQLLTDRRQFKGIIYRLLDNAIKYSDEGGEVSISLDLQHRKEEEEEDMWVVVRIMDEGPGIKDTAKIWEPFSSDTGSVSRTSSGLGLGLAYVHNVVHRLGGDVEVASRGQKKGSIFSVSFPLALPPLADIPTKARALERSSDSLVQADAASGSIDREGQSSCSDMPKPEPRSEKPAVSQPEKLAVPAQTFSRPPNGERTVSCPTSSGSSDERDGTTRQRKTLVVEDDVINAKILLKTFEKAGHITKWAKNGKIGYEEAQETSFDLIIMDMMMPIMDGLESTRKIRLWEAKNRRKPAHIVGFTANTAARSLDDCMDAGMDLVLLKPLSGQTLLSAVSPFSRD